MIRKFFCLVFVISKINGIYSDCLFNNYEHEDYTGIFLRPFGKETIIFNPKGPIHVPEDGHVSVYCQSGFENNEQALWNTYLSDEGEKIKNLSIRCNKHHLYYKVAEHNKIEANTKIVCGGNNANFYRHDIDYCEYDSFIYGLPIMDSSVILLELCYDFDLTEIMFFRYIATKRTSFLEKQELYNPSKMNSKLDGLQKFVFPPKQRDDFSFNQPRDNKFNFTTYSGSTNFEIRELVSFEKYAKLFEKFLGETSEINSVMWWSPLKNGNWKVYERLLENEALEYDLDIFAGKSGVVTYPFNEKCTVNTELQIDVYGTKTSVPLFIWNYIRSKDNELGQHNVVILGVNSPFFEGADSNVTKICNDICDKIPWLNSLDKTRKMTAFGYIFCCKPEEVKLVLDGFPNIAQEGYVTQTKPSNDSI